MSNQLPMARPVELELPTTTITLTSVRLAYRALKNEAEDIAKGDSDKFDSIINEVDRLHQFVQSPREQIVDAEAFLGITSSLGTWVKAHVNDGITASDFVSCLLRDFGKQAGPSSSAQSGSDLMNWKNIGVTASDIFRSCPGCHTMMEPMDTELKIRKAVVRKRLRPTESSQPEEVDGLEEDRTDTDKNMATMFNILRMKRSVKLENLVLNSNSFSQTVENLFTLSFLVKDGRAEIKVKGNGWHLVSPRNAASASEVASGEVVYRHFVFRFDFKDWKMMSSVVGEGEELIPNRDQINSSYDKIQDSACTESQEAGTNTPIRKFSRNSGLVLQEEKTVERDNTQVTRAVNRWKRRM